MISGRDVRIRINAHGITFPPTCPICQEHATRHRPVSKTKKNRLEHAVNSEYRRRRTKTYPTQRFSLHIPVCDKHYKSADELRLSQTMLGLFLGVSAFFSIFLSIVTGFNWYDGRILPLEIYLLCVLSWIGFIWSGTKLGGSDLERVISIIDFVQGNPAIKIRVRDAWYADEILSINPSARILPRRR